MKKLLFAAAALLAGLCVSCIQIDQDIYDRIDSLEGRVVALESQVSTINSNVEAIQALLSALQSQISVASVTPASDGGFTVKFSDGKSFVIANGKDGADGKNAPVIGAKKDADGVWYWTLDGEWLTADGAKVPAQGKDATDGKTPQLKVEDGWWLLSYDGESWEKLVEADPAAAAPSISITEDDNFVYFTQSDGTVVKLSKLSGFAFLLEETEFIVKSAEAFKVPYTLANGDETVRFSVLESVGGYTLDFEAVDANSGNLIVTPAAAPVDGYMVIAAVKNSTGDLKMQKISFTTYVAPELVTLTWDFSTPEWQAALGAVVAPSTDYTGWDLTYDGLTFLSPGKSKYNTTYIQAGGKGSKTDRVLKFVAPQKGILTVWASNTGGSDDFERCVTVVVDDGEEQKVPGGSASTSPLTEAKFNIPAGQVYIYPTGNALRFYKIEFTYMSDGSDIPAKEHTLLWNFTDMYTADINVSDSQNYLLKDDGTVEAVTAFETEKLYLSPNGKAIKSNNKTCSADGLSYHPLSYGGGAAYMFIRTAHAGTLKVTATIGKDPASADNCKLGIKLDGALQEATQVDLAAYDLSVAGCAAKTYEWAIEDTGAVKEIQIVKPSGANSPWFFQVEFTYSE